MRLDVDAVVPGFSKAMNSLDRATTRELDRVGFSASLCELVTLATQTKVPPEEFAAAAEQFSTDELGALLALVVTINAWNAIGVAARPWGPTLTS